MKPFQANLINAIVLIVMSLWGYFGAGEGASPTALIPTAFGVIFLLVTPPFRKDNKVVAHIVVLLTFLLIIALIRPLTGAISDGRTMAVVRVGLMIASSIFAMIIFIQSFIAARKAKKAS